MDSKNSLKLVFLLFSIFIVHLFLYYFFPSYGNYFKDIKYDGNINNEKEYSAEVNNKASTIKGVSSYTGSKFVIPDINNNENLEDNLIEQDNNLEEEDNSSEIVNHENTETNEILDENNTDNTNIIVDDTGKQEIFDLFSDFNLEQKEKSKITSLFGLTNEYPYDFEEYYSKEKKMNLYVFKDKPYEDILNIFDVISYNLYFKIKKVNNFGDKSFYINLDQDLDDSYIRFVFSYKNNNFGLKIKKDGYNEVKTIMKSIGKIN